MAETDQTLRQQFLQRELESIAREMREGFAGVHARLDRVNGRLDKHGDAIAEQDTHAAEQGSRLKNLEREVFDRPKAQVTAVVAPTSASAAKEGVETITLSLTPKMWTLLAGLFGALQFIAPIIGKKLGLW